MIILVHQNMPQTTDSLALQPFGTYRWCIINERFIPDVIDCLPVGSLDAPYRTSKTLRREICLGNVRFKASLHSLQKLANAWAKCA